MRGELTVRAAGLHLETEKMLRTPAAMFLPAPVREVIRNLAELVREMADRIETIEGGKRHGGA